MRKTVCGLLAFLLSSNAFSAQILVERGTLFRLLPPSIDFDSLSYGQKLLFTVAEDVVVSGKVVAQKGDTVPGEVLSGVSRNMAGAPEMILVQLGEYTKGGVSIPLMKTIELKGSNRLVWEVIFSLPTLCF